MSARAINRLLVATRSPHKLGEIREILGTVPGLDLVSLDDIGVPPDPEEDAVEAFDTFEENALAKARYFARRCSMPALADDSGLVVDALGGAPGVRSRRFAARPGLDGEALDAANNALLLQRLRGVAPEHRTARYVCAVALVPAGHEPPVVVRGTCEGRIGLDPRGSHGFGYDPLFIVAGGDRTFAELDPAEKNRRSHRARALRELARRLRQVREPGE